MHSGFRSLLTCPFALMGAGSSSGSSSTASSSISVVSVPFEVTGDGPTMSLGLGASMEENRLAPTEFGCSEAASVEFRADLYDAVSIGQGCNWYSLYIQRLEPWGVGHGW